MKTFLKIAILLISVSYTYSQVLEFSEYVDESESIVVPEVAEAISSQTTYFEVVIVAKDSGSTPEIPAWYDETFNTWIPLFFSEGTFGNFTFGSIILKADENLNYAFIFPTYYEPFHGGCWHVHSQINMIDVIEQADAIYDFSLLDFNNDNIVPVHFTSIGPKSGGVSGFCLEVTTNDIGVGGGNVKVRVVQQTRGSGADVFKGVYTHESGHTFFGFPDMNHSGLNSYNHYSVGAFEVMAGGGFQGKASLYNPWFRHVKQWCSPTLIESNLNEAVLEDFQSSQNYYLYIPNYTPPNSMTNQKYLISYHTPANQF